jgi:hypothetical protein
MTPSDPPQAGFVDNSHMTPSDPPPGSVTQYVRRFRSHSDASQADRRRVLSTIHT